MGRTSPENFTSLINGVKSRIFDKLPDDTWFYPGHGDDFTLGKERPQLDEMASLRLMIAPAGSSGRPPVNRPTDRWITVQMTTI